MTTRSGLLGAMLAACVAPAFVGAGVLMPVKAVWTHSALVLYGDGVHDDTAAMQAFADGKRVAFNDGAIFNGNLGWRTVRMSGPVMIPRAGNYMLSDGTILNTGEHSSIVFPSDHTGHAHLSYLYFADANILQVRK